MKHHTVYLLSCSDGSYHSGHTDDLATRLIDHEAGRVPYTASRRPVYLVWQGDFDSLERATAFEQQIKRWSHAEKALLVQGHQRAMQSLNPEGRGATLHMHQRPQAPQIQQGPSSPAGADGARSAALLQAVRSADAVQQRRGIAKAITLLESTRPDHRVQADGLLTDLLAHTGRSFRLGISGVPGVGKSTFIEALGLHLIAQGHRVAVLAVDPSSSVSGGSILGDKTRMEKLSVNEQAYIRPSPASGTLGGVAEKTREAMLVCEAAGYDVVIVETVGVGQSETAVAGMTDMFVLMQLPNAGDDLQAIKKGVMELADLVLINKADIDPDAATRAEAQIGSALRLLGLHGPQGTMAQAHQAPVEPSLAGGAPAVPPSRWSPQVVQVSALQAQGIDRFWSKVSEFRQHQQASGLFDTRRQQQALAWMWERIDTELRQAFRQHPGVRERLPGLSADVVAGRVAASSAARALLAACRVGPPSQTSDGAA